MKGLMMLAAGCAILVAGCAMSTSDRLEIVDVDGVEPGDTVHLYATGWICSSRVGALPRVCPAQAPARVTWRVDRGDGEGWQRVVARGSGELQPGAGVLAGDDVAVWYQ